MMKSMLKRYEMILYSLDMRNFVSYIGNVPSKITIEKITLETIEAMRKKYLHKYRKWKRYLRKNIASGVAAACDNEVVGYGWLKVKKAHDLFYKIKGENIAYLCEYYVDASLRGNNIYPALIPYLIENNFYYKYYISAYSSNLASNKGIVKVGFKVESSFTFLRALKVTLNKHILR